jgi:hypothetical protein
LGIIYVGLAQEILKESIDMHGVHPSLYNLARAPNENWMGVCKITVAENFSRGNKTSH